MTYITFNQLQTKLGNRSRSSVYRDLDAGRLPRPVKLGSRLYWREDEIDTTLAALAEASQT